MKKKVKRFQEGGFSKEQEEWLGGADRTDPYILARMRKAVPDKPKAEKKDEQTIKTETKQGEHPKIDADTRKKALRENAPVFLHKRNTKSITPDSFVRRDILNQFPNSETGLIRRYTSKEYDDAGYKKGGKISSASKRADGCAVRGKTRA